MVLSFADQLSASSTVDVVLSNSADDDDSSAETIAASRVNPYTYSFNAPAGQRTRFFTLFQWRSQKFPTGGASICSIPFCPFPFSCPTKSAVQSKNVMTYHTA